MNKVIIIGAGGHAAELMDYLGYINQQFGTGSPRGWDIVGLIDDSHENYLSYRHHFPYLGAIKNHAVRTDLFYIMGIANMKYRRHLIDQFLRQGADFITVVHPTALVSPSAVLGKGCVISHNASIGPKAIIGDFNLINSRCTIGHDSRIGNYNFLSPQVVTGGFAQLGDENFLGTNSVLLPSLTVGNGNTIAAGMIIDKHVGDNTVVFHRFKEKVTIISRT